MKNFKSKASRSAARTTLGALRIKQAESIMAGLTLAKEWVPSGRDRHGVLFWDSKKQGQYRKDGPPQPPAE